MTPPMEKVKHFESFELSMKHNALPANMALANASDAWYRTAPQQATLSTPT